jgi:hypothetical protein
MACARGVEEGVGVTVAPGVNDGVAVGAMVGVALGAMVGVAVGGIVGVAGGVTVATGVGVGVGVAGVGVGVAGVGVSVGPGVRLGVGVGPPVTSRNAALIGPQVWKLWKSVTPRPRTKITWRPNDRLAVLIVALTATVAELNVPVMGMAVPPAQGGVSM